MRDLENGEQYVPDKGRQRVHPVIMEVPPAVRQLSGREKVQALREHARAALAQSASYSGVNLGALKKGERGQPLPSFGAYWSLSHTSDYVAAVAAPHRIGIDIEKIRSFTAALKNRVAEEREWKLSSAIDETLFCRYWTAKEAVLKAVGAGLSGLSQCLIRQITGESQMVVSYGSETWLVSHCSKAEHHLAAITAAADHVSWHVLEHD